MFEEIKKSLKASLYERTASPIVGAFVSAWLIINWKLCLIIVLAKDTIYERLAHIEGGGYIGIWPNLYAPLISAVIFLAIYPLVSIYPYRWWEWYAKKKTEIKNSMQRGVLLSLEKSIALRNEIDSQEAKFEEMLKSKEQKNSELMVMHDNLQKLLEEKEQENRKLLQQLQDESKKKSTKIKNYVKKIGPAETWPFPAPEITSEKAEGSKSAKNTVVVNGIPSTGRKEREAEWDAEYEEILKKNPSFPILFDEALDAAVTQSRLTDTNTKKVSLVHGVIELSDNGQVKMTEKGQYMAKKIV